MRCECKVAAGIDAQRFPLDAATAFAKQMAMLVICQ